ncbi:DUF3883 domain-containing protein [Nitrosopumilus sp.]|nr:DUF3883 domain-containing protein [Nitrosopumilus sp.]MDB4839891.1 DUF3883 domain-containing protein [Nitrosopumilus sp.]
MTLSLNDLSRILRLVKLYQRESNSSRNYVKKSYDSEPIKQLKLPNYDEIETFCLKLNLIIKNDAEIKLTEFGIELFELFENDLSLANKKIVEQCFEIQDIKKNIENALEKFHYSNGKKWFPKWDVVNLFENVQILPILYQTGFLQKNDLSIIINPEFDKLISKKVKKKITLEQLEKNLEHQKKIGDIAEEIVLNFEKNRLKNLGFEDESNKTRKISIDFANAGYDIESFNGKTSDGLPNRFIEVKGTTKKELDFHWSINEINTAKNLGSNYWIYHVSEIDVQNKISINEPKMINNPYDSIFSNDLFEKNIESYYIKEKEDNPLK